MGAVHPGESDILVGVGHYSYLRIGHGTFFWCRSSYDPDLAALFSESDRYFEEAPDRNYGYDQYRYQTTARQMRQRLQTRGFTTARAWEGLEESVKKWADESHGEHSHENAEKVLERYVAMLKDDALLTSPGEPEDLIYHLDFRNVLRLLLEKVPDDTTVALDLSELTGCCVEMDSQVPIAEPARQQQLRQVAAGSPLIVLTEGSTDSRALAAGMAVTHPHLTGFVNIMDSNDLPAEGGAAALARMVYSFAAAGVANHVVAVADNDTAAFAALEKVKNDRSLPAHFKVIHYPDLPMLAQYPTVGPYTPEPVLADVNGRAGALEMYFGHDALIAGGSLAPVQWSSWDNKLRRYQGSLLDRDKKLVQKAFHDKVAAAKRNAGTTGADWTGIEAIIEGILGAFE